MKQTQSMWRALRSRMLTGLVVIAPFAITLFVIYSILAWFVRVFSRATATMDLFQGMHPAMVFLLNLALGVALLAVVLLISGEVAETFSGQRFIDFWEEVVERIPVGGTLYRALKQVLAPGRGAFKKVVMIEYPRPGVFAIGFMTGQPGQAISEYARGEFANVFIPSALNPTGGWLVIVPRAEVRELNMTAEEALAFIISGGMASGPTASDSGEEPSPVAQKT